MRNLHVVSTLQDGLVAELKEIFKDSMLKHADGSYGPPAVFSQRLPLNNNDDDDELSLAPYIIVMLSDFTIEGWAADKKISVVLVLCSWDGGDDRAGDKDNMIMMDKILERFGKNPHLGNFTLEMPIEGAWQEKDTYPFFFGALELSFSSITYEVEDDLA